MRASLSVSKSYNELSSMPHFLSRFFDWLFRRQQVVSDPSRLTFEGLMTELGIEHYASRNGKADKPPTESNSPDDCERRIAKRISHEKASAHRVWENRRSSLVNRMAALQFRGGVAQIRAQAIGAVGAFQAAAKATVAEAYLASHEAEQQHAALERFKSENKLTRAAHYPDTPILQIGIISVVLLFELMLNAYFFGKGDPMGYLGGFNHAFALAVCNIGVTVFASAVLLRKIFHRSFLRRLFFGTIYMGVLLFVFLLNVVFAKARDLMQNPDLQASLAATQSFLPTTELLAPILRQQGGAASNDLTTLILEQAKHLLTYEHFDSYLLLLSTCVFCLLAAYEVYKMDDPYPDYGKRTRAYKDSHEAWMKKRNTGLESLAKEQAKQLKRIEDIERAVDGDLSLRDRLLADSNENDGDYFRLLQRLSSFEVKLVDKYREINGRVRSTPPPSYFGVNVVPDEPVQPTPLTPFPGERQTLLEAFNEQRVAAASEISQAYNVAVAEIGTLTFHRNSNVTPT
jgi:hypothetical protein